MAFINKHLYLVVPLAHEKWWLETMVRFNFLATLNDDVNPKWHRKLQKQYMKLPESVRGVWDGESFLALPSILELASQCLDMDLFTRKFMTAESVRFLAANFPFMVLDRTTVTQEKALRDKFLRWRYLVLKNMVQTLLAQDNANNEEVPEIEQVQKTAEQASDVVQFKDKHGLDGFVPHTESGPVPTSMYSRLTTEKLEAIFVLVSEFGMALTRISQLISGIVGAVSAEEASHYLSLLTTHVPETYTYSEVVALLKTLVVCRENILAVPLESRASSPYSQLMEQVLVFVEDALTKFYGTEQKDDEMVWELLRQLEMPDLLDLVVSLGGSPTFDGA